jgi:hypothetical protein
MNVFRRAQTRDWRVSGADIRRRVRTSLSARRRRVLVHASILFLASLAGFAALRAKDIRGPSPPPGYRKEFIDEADTLGPNRGREARAEWVKVWILVLQAETSPSPDALRQSIHALRRFLLRRDFSRTAYSSEAVLEERRLMAERNRRFPEKPEDIEKAPSTDR